MYKLRVCIWYVTSLLYILWKCNNKKGKGCLGSIRTSLLSTCIPLECSWNVIVPFISLQDKEIKLQPHQVLGCRSYFFCSTSTFLEENEKQNCHNNLQMLKDNLLIYLGNASKYNKTLRAKKLMPCYLQHLLIFCNSMNKFLSNSSSLYNKQRYAKLCYIYLLLFIVPVHSDL